MSDTELVAKADADLSDKQYHIIRLTGDRTCNIGSLATDLNLAGVLQNKPKSGDHATVKFMGRGKVVAGAAISANALFTTNGSGRAVAASTNSGGIDTVVGRVLQAAGGDGEIVDCVYLPPFRLSNN